jgi:hypothetical protein
MAGMAAQDTYDKGRARLKKYKALRPALKLDPFAYWPPRTSYLGELGGGGAFRAMAPGVRVSSRDEPLRIRKLGGTGSRARADPAISRGEILGKREPRRRKMVSGALTVSADQMVSEGGFEPPRPDKATRPSTHLRTWRVMSTRVLQRSDLHGCRRPSRRHGVWLHGLPDFVGQFLGATGSSPTRPTPLDASRRP